MNNVFSWDSLGGHLIVDSTAISFVDGVNGMLFYRGIDVAQLAAHASFEETVWLLLSGTLPSAQQLKSLHWNLSHMSRVQEKVLRIIHEFPQSASLMFVLQTALSALACVDVLDHYVAPENQVEKAFRLIAQSIAIIAASYRNYLGASMLEPRSDLSFVDNFIYMLSGKVPTKLQSHCMETALIVQMEHGLNSSTFAVRTMASIKTNFYSCVSAGVGALTGPLHGGASERVSFMLEAAKECGDVSGFVRDLLARGGKIMGMGHRTYKTVDPRAVLMKLCLEKLTNDQEKDSDLEALKALEKQARLYFAQRNKPVYTNVDFWTGAVYKKLGLTPALYPCIFAASRIVGWCAHVLEVTQKEKLYSPKPFYTGNLYVPYVPIDQR